MMDDTLRRLVSRCGLVVVVVLAAPPAAGGADPDPRVLEVLERMDRAGRDLRDLSCRVRYTRTQLIQENPGDPEEPREVEHHHGTVRFLRRPDLVRTLIHFQRSDDGRHVDRKQVWYLFDGRWLTEAKERGKTVIRRELIGPGQRIDPFKLGEGPFPLPFGQSKADMLAHFRITRVAPAPADPPQADHLHCVPLPGGELAREWEWIDLFISRAATADAAGLPVLMRGRNRLEQTDNAAAFQDLHRNRGLEPEALVLPEATSGWQTFVEPLSTSPGN